MEINIILLVYESFIRAIMDYDLFVGALAGRSVPVGVSQLCST